ncbi:hypothetical protein EPN90_02110 [Patescibacteria group bacterium]|nr:MAG: hypothetical protein EPN90_02110 [Patescibacteria group bacterium]
MNEEKIINKLLEIEEKLGLLATKEELHQFQAEVMDAFDKQWVILQRLDQERIFTTEWIRRIEDDVNRIKAHLKLA